MTTHTFPGKFRSLLVLGLVAMALLAQATVSADQPYAGDRNVTGTAPGATSLTVYEVTPDGKRYLGSGNSIDKDGVYAVAVNPPLSLGQQIVVVDSQGRSTSKANVIQKSDPTAIPR